MTNLLKAYIKIRDEYEAAVSDFDSMPMKEIQRLNNLKWDKQEPLLAQMSQAELQYVLDNYIKSAQAKYEFQKKYMKKKSGKKKSNSTFDELAAVQG